MRIETIHIDGFGALSDRHYELQGPVTLFYGANEAGKSTLLQSAEVHPCGGFTFG